MAQHRLIDLALNEDKENNVYRYIESWISIPSAHGSGIYYLIMRGVFQWGEKRDRPITGIAVAMQYSRETGKRVDVSQPAHIASEDIPAFVGALNEFIGKNEGDGIG